MTDKKLKILMVSAEVVPFAKTGGLADVAGSLPIALAKLGHDVRIAMPKYRQIQEKMSYVVDFPVQVDWHKETCIVRESTLSFQNGKKQQSLPVYFVDNYQYFDREYIYCYFDEAERFSFFCRAVIDMLPEIGFQPDIIHCNDWHTGPVCMLLKEQYEKFPFYEDIRTVFTVHNLQYQGNYPGDTIKLYNIDPAVFNPDKVEFYGMFSFMKAGLVYADVINTVSKTYAEEVKTVEYGEKLEGLMIKRADSLFGIVNGISYTDFDPENDPEIFAHFNADNLGGKKLNKRGLQEEMGLPVTDAPLIGIVHRLVGQKGLELFMEVSEEIMKKDVQLVVLGLGDPVYEEFFTKLKEKYPEKVGVFIGFNAPLAQKIYAGSDMFLMPSKFEPCGLGQLISLRYGTIPIVRATGGLKDTVQDYTPTKEKGNGFSFSEFSSAAFYDTLSRAIDVYVNMPEKWERLVKYALSLDFSWNKSALEYMSVFEAAISKKPSKVSSVQKKEKN